MTIKSLEMAQKAAKAAQKAQVELDVLKNHILGARGDAQETWNLSQQPPGTPGAAEARQELTRIEATLAEMKAQLPAAKAKVDGAREAAREAGLRASEDGRQMLEKLVADFRKMEPLFGELDAINAVCRESGAPQPGFWQGRHDPLQTLPDAIRNVQDAIRFYDERVSVNGK
jgi:hypothetical protein